MALIVQKYGGTSIGSLERIQQVAERVIKARAEGHNVIVVVSAMSGETDRLIQLTQAITSFPAPREYAALVSTGEQVSMSILAMALIARGCPACSYTGAQAQIHTNHDFKKARIMDINPQVLREALAAGKVAVVAGFQGIDGLGNITTLGRGGSDTTAVAIAAALKADECQIYTDVDGVYTTDPRVVPQARRLRRVTFEEMLEMASLGAKVLQIRSVEFAGKYNVPLRVLSSFHEGEGTLITFEQTGMEQPYVSAIAFNRDEAKITVVEVPDKPGIAANILGPISKANIDIDMIVQNGSVADTTNFTFTVHRDDYEKAMQIVEESNQKIQAARIVGNNKIAKLSLVGVGMRSHAGIASTMFETLAKEGINIQLVSTSEIKISVIIDEKYLELGVRTLHDAFGLDKPPRQEFDPMKK
jgi:aspartate kinase